jgi:hypothetical protein
MGAGEEVLVPSRAFSSARPTDFALHGESLSLCSCKEKVTKEKARPIIRPCASLRVPSLRRHAGGRRTRGIHAPLRLSPHPCGSPLYATPALGLLNGTGELPAGTGSILKKAFLLFALLFAEVRIAPAPPSSGRTESPRKGLSRMDAAKGPWAMDGPSGRAPGAAMERGNPERSAGPDDGGGLLLGYFFLARQEKVTRRARRNLPHQPRKAPRSNTKPSRQHAETTRRIRPRKRIGLAPKPQTINASPAPQGNTIDDLP